MMNLNALKIDPEFQGKIPPLTFEELNQLEANILRDGRIINPIIVWQGLIVDGHNRYTIAKKHPEIPFTVHEKEFASRYEAIIWICKNQLGRRNLTPEQKKYLIGKQYEAEKCAKGGDRKSLAAQSTGQNGPLIDEHPTRKRIASENGVNDSFVKRAEQFSKGVDAAEEAVPGTRQKVLSGEVKPTAAEFDKRIANAPKVSSNGHYYVFDGQHTIAARKLRNNNCDLDILCKVYSGLTEQEEALLFAQQTGISAPLTAGAKLRAKIHGGDSEAIAFLSATQRAGFGLSFNQSHAKWKIACIATAFGEYRQHGERIYTDALRVLAEAWEGDIDSLRSEVLQGVVRFVALYDHEYDPIRLIKQLKRISPLTIYRSGQAMSGPNYQKYMHQILKVYNGSSRSKSLPIKQ